MSEFRMPPEVFEELLALVARKHTPSEATNPQMRSYGVEKKLLITLNFLAHCPTLRFMAFEWGVPHNSISEVCLHPIVKALQQVFLEDAATKNIQFPKTAAEQQAVMVVFHCNEELPGVIGAIYRRFTHPNEETFEERGGGGKRRLGI
jgi:hypothetical protein